MCESEYRELFDYFTNANRHGFKSLIGTFVSHNINWINQNGELITPNDVNALDRMKLAEAFCQMRTWNGKYKIHNYRTTREYEDFELMNDIAQFIDLKIPKSYWIRLYEKENRAGDRSQYASKYPGINGIEGLNFFYDENYGMEDNSLTLTKEAVRRSAIKAANKRKYKW